MAQGHGGKLGGRLSKSNYSGMKISGKSVISDTHAIAGGFGGYARTFAAFNGKLENLLCAFIVLEN